MEPRKEVSATVMLYDCRAVEWMKVGGRRFIGWFAIRRRRMLLDWLVLQAGFNLFGSLIQRFSNDPDHGYTYVAVIGQSAITIHTYPELGTVTVRIVTCPGEDEDGSATRKFAAALRWRFGAVWIETEPVSATPLIKRAA